jgi:hypothetical protein
MEITNGPEVRYNSAHCRIAIQQFASRVVVLKISGTDVGEFGEAPMLGLNKLLASTGPVQLFIDARNVRGASIGVSGDWARWLGAQKQNLREVHMLTGSRFIQVTADFVRRFAELQGIMKVYTDRNAFEDAFGESLDAATAG